MRPNMTHTDCSGSDASRKLMICCSQVIVSAAPWRAVAQTAGLRGPGRKGQILDRLFSDCGSGRGTRVQPCEKFQEVGHSCAGFGREFEPLDARPQEFPTSW